MTRTDGASEPSLAGRAVLVTGASRGIGLACARAILDAGGRVLLAARGARELERAQRELGERYGTAVASEPGDVAEAEDVERWMRTGSERFGVLDGLVHAAAIPGPIGPTLDVDPAEWLETVRVDLFGSFLVGRAVARHMRERGAPGSIVLLSGGGATSPFPNFTAYGCSKAGVVRLAETLAVELMPLGIRVNALAPGFVATRMHDATLVAGERAGAEYLQRTRRELAEGGVPAEVAAAAAVFLLSDRSKGISGRLLAAPWDAWQRWPEHVAELADRDLFTLRRIVPRDRGADWQ